jgi:hypothetical protein
LLDVPASFEELIGTNNNRSLAGMIPGILKYTDWIDIAKAVNAEIM